MARSRMRNGSPPGSDCRGAFFARRRAGAGSDRKENPGGRQRAAFFAACWRAPGWLDAAAKRP